MTVKVAFASVATAEARAVGIRPEGELCPSSLAADQSGLIGRVLARHHKFAGDEEEVLPVCIPSGWLVLVGMGASDEQTDLRLRQIGGALVAELADGGIEHLDVCLDLGPADAAELAYGVCLRAWRPPARYRTKADPEEEWTLSSITVVTDDPRTAETHFARLAGRAEGARLARDLVVAPGNELTPKAFVDRLEGLSSLGITLEVIDPATHNLNLLAAVGQGSIHPPCLAVLHWRGSPRADDPPVVLVGKGITFDTGGISIKPDEDMEEMKGDMAGAAAVAGTLYALAARRAPVNAVGVLAIAENMPSGRATRPGDVVASHAGLTVEIIDTDAEGRLVLADALSFAGQRYKPKAMIDLATLTGAVEVALGYHRAGLFSADDLLADRLLAAGEAEGELLWRLPLTDRYDEALKSDIADLRNCQWADGPDHLHAARFLERFVPEGVPWAHLDIAGTADAKEDEALAGKGSNGFGIRLLDRLVANAFEG